jgi:hypothetical protein
MACCHDAVPQPVGGGLTGAGSLSWLGHDLPRACGQSMSYRDSGVGLPSAGGFAVGFALADKFEHAG